MACQLSFVRESNSDEWKRWGHSGEQAWAHRAVVEVWAHGSPRCSSLSDWTTSKTQTFSRRHLWVWSWVSHSSTEKFGWHLAIKIYHLVIKTFILVLSLSILSCSSVPLIQYHIDTKAPSVLILISVLPFSQLEICPLLTFTEVQFCVTLLRHYIFSSKLYFQAGTW